MPAGLATAPENRVGAGICTAGAERAAGQPGKMGMVTLTDNKAEAWSWVGGGTLKELCASLTGRPCSWQDPLVIYHELTSH